MSQYKYIPFWIFQLILGILFIFLVEFKTDDPHGSNVKASGFEDAHVMIFIGFGYLMTFLKKYSYSALGLNWFLAAMVIQWAILWQAFPINNFTGKVALNKRVILEADVMAATILITFGAMLGIASSVQLLFIAIVETVVACMNIYLVGEKFKAADVGGSIAIHSFGAYFGLACSWVLGRQSSTKDENDRSPETDLNGPSYISDVTAMIGSLFLFIYWPSFNSALAKSEQEYQKAVINTYLGIAAASVTAFCISAMVNKEKGKFDMVHVQNSTLAGGVALGSICNMEINPGYSILFGMSAGCLSVYGYRYLTPFLEKKLGLHDTCGVNNLHGMPGLFSGILSAIVAAVGTKEAYGTRLDDIFPAINEDKISFGSQGLNQFLALVVTFVIAVVSGAITGFIARLKIFFPLKKNERYNDHMNFELPA